VSATDLVAIVAYFITVITVGFLYRRRAAVSLESYFLGGKRIHWSMLAMSGAVSNFDTTGTMWMVSVMFILGM
jgi:Na+/proline symporter